ncbi:MAG: helix-turn-helix transcriptional regulator [Candidatus Competibacter sp.]|jgi:transcriptional regulator with XRE-family HTH domain
MSDIGHAIVVRRTILKVNQAELARRIGVARSYISLLENGERPLSDELLQRISAALGCKPEDFTKWQQAA